MEINQKGNEWKRYNVIKLEASATIMDTQWVSSRMVGNVKTWLSHQRASFLGCFFAIGRWTFKVTSPGSWSVRSEVKCKMPRQLHITLSVCRGGAAALGNGGWMDRGVHANDPTEKSMSHKCRSSHRIDRIFQMSQTDNSLGMIYIQTEGFPKGWWIVMRYILPAMFYMEDKLWQTVIVVP